MKGLIFLFSSLVIMSSAQTRVNYDSIRIILEDIYESDQGIRKEFMDSSKGNKTVSRSLINKMAKIDRINKIKIRSILNSYGWVERSKIGQKASSGIFYAVQHTDLVFIEKFFPMLKALAEAGEAKKTEFATMQDRILMWRGKRQIYGTQCTESLRLDGKLVVWPIEDPSNVNNRRKEMGFDLSVEDNAKLLEAAYNPLERLPAEKDH